MGTKETVPEGVLTEVSEPEFFIHILRSLLHYHERMMIPLRNEEHCKYGVAATDVYSDALREAIRCMEQVHGINTSPDHPDTQASAPSTP